MEHFESLLIALTIIQLAAWLLCRQISAQIAICDFIWRTALVLVALSPALLLTRIVIEDWQWQLPVWPAPATRTVPRTIPTASDPELLSFVRRKQHPNGLNTAPFIVPTEDDPSITIPTIQERHGPITAPNVPVDQTSNPVQPQTWSWMRVVASLWLTGSLAHLVVLAISAVSASRLRRNSAPVTDAECLALNQACAEHVSLRRVPSLRTNSMQAGPVVLGLLRPQIVVPPELLVSETRNDLRAVLLHECGHLRRSDLAFELVLRVVLSAFWPHPLLHLMAREIRRLREEMCDNYVLAREPAIPYAETLLRVAVHQRLSHTVLLGIGVFSRSYRLEQRVASILSPQRQTKTSAARHVRIVLTCSVIILLGLGLLVRVTSLSAGRLHSDSESLATGDATNTETTKDQSATVAASDNDSRKREIEKAIAEATVNPIEIAFRIVNSEGQPVVGAKTVPGGVASFSGASWGSEAQFSQACESDLDGYIRFPLPKEVVANAVALSALGSPSEDEFTQWEGLSSYVPEGFPKALRKLGIHKLYVKIDHPEHPLWWNYLELGGNPQIVLSDSYEIIVTARREGEPELVRRVVPRLMGSHSTDWSEEQGIITYRRVDLTDPQSHPSIQMIHFPEQGPAWFSDVIDLKHIAGNPLRLEATLHPGVRVRGQLAADVPRPVKNGVVWGKAIHLLENSNRGAVWSVNTKIAEDGTFSLDSLPAQQTLQIIALCDGWSSQPPTQLEMKEFKAEHHFPQEETGFARAAQVLPRLVPLGREEVNDLIVPMLRTASCEITAVDELNQPIPGVKVQFNPNQVFHHWGSTALGTGQDDASLLLEQLTSGNHDLKLPTGSAYREFAGETDMQGKVIIVELPCAAPDAPATHDMAAFLALHETYVAESSAIPQMPNFLGMPFVPARLTPGRATKLTLKMATHHHIASDPEHQSDDEPGDRALVSGRVENSQGHPLEGVEVLFGDEDCFGIRTDANGRFEHRFEQEMIDGEVESMPLPLRFVKAGFAPATRLVRLGVLTTKVQMQQETWFEGTVRKPDGSPAANVPVVAFHEGFSGRVEYTLNLKTATTTNSEGRYRLLVEPAEYRVMAGADESGVAWIPRRDSGQAGERLKLPISLGDHQTLDIQLERGVKFTAQFIDQSSGQPIPSVLLFPDEDFIQSESLGKTDAAGIVNYPALPAGPLHFQIATPEHLRCFSNEAIETQLDPSSKLVSTEKGLTFNLQPGIAPIKIYCERGIEVSGVVVDPEGSPVTNADVSLATGLADASSQRSFRHRHRTDHQGHFQFLLPPSGLQPYVLIAEPREPSNGGRKWSSGLSASFFLNENKPVQNLEILLTEPGAIRGRVIDRQGNPVAQVLVQATPIDLPDLAESAQSTNSLRDGTFELNRLRPGRYWLHGPTRPANVVAASHLPDVEVISNETSRVGDVEIPFNDAAKTK